MKIGYEAMKEVLENSTEKERQITAIFYLKDIKDRLDVLIEHSKL